MRKTLMTAAILALVAGGASAQTTNPAATDGPQNRPVNSSDSVNRQVTAPVKGSNSFTEGQAKSRIESMGFSDVHALAKDDNGVWRGQATKSGKPVEVSLDFQGNVVQGGSMGSTMPNNAAQGATPGNAGR
ncbi:MAG TPA: hypothetical protein VHY35_02610 [Stellaceae bacterium]|jgi:hypothetical protein|nr:hypothetical protein [Stellaceae bacterium]